MTFSSKDTGDIYYLYKIIAPQHLGLKVGVNVFLLTILSDDPVNERWEQSTAFIITHCQ